MENAPRLYDAVFSMLGQHSHWRDVRHLKTLYWMVVGLILSSQINLTDWLDYTCSRAMFAQSIQRRFSRWLNNSRIHERKLYAPLIRQALSEWKVTRLVRRARHEFVMEPLLFDPSFPDLSRTSHSGDVEGDAA